MPPSIDPAYQLAGPKVAANPWDKWVLCTGHYIIVITESGGVFAHSLGFTTPPGRYNIEDPFPLQGPPVASHHPQDNWVLAGWDSILVITREGAVFGHDHRLERFLEMESPLYRTIGEAYKLEGPPVAANLAVDNHVLYAGGKILVITKNGAVFAHVIEDRRVRNAYPLAGPPVAANLTVDRHVIYVNGDKDMIWVITVSGEVFAHDIDTDRREISTAYRIPGAPVAANQQVDRTVLLHGRSLLVITRDGRVFDHSIQNLGPTPR